MTQGFFPRARALALALSVVVSACAPAGPDRPAPGDVVRDYLAAVERGDADAAYDLLGPSLREDMSRERFRDYFDRFRPELHAQAEAAVEAVSGRPAELVARVRLGEDAVTVREHKGAWLLTEPLWPAPADGPRAALRDLARRLDEADVPATPEGDTVTVTLEGGGEVTLRRTEDGWRVESVAP